MAIRTYTTAGVNLLWSNVANWDTGVPADTDSAVIPAGQTCTLDVNQTLFPTGMAGLTINGTLQASLLVDSYLKMAGNITATAAGGIFYAGTGTGASRFPSARVCTVYFNGNYQFACNALNYLTLKFWCYAPTASYAQLISATSKAITSVTTGTTTTIGCTGHGYSAGAVIYLANVGGFDGRLSNRTFHITTVATDSFTIHYPDSDIAVDSTGFGTWTAGGLVCPSQAEAAAQTQLEIDTNLSADPEWGRAGARVRIDNINRASSPELLTLASAPAATYITTTVGLAATKLSGSLAILVTRNVRILSSATAITNGMIRYGTGHQLDCEIRPGGTADGVTEAINSVFAGGVISGCNYGVASGSGHSLSGGVISGCTYGINYGSGHSLSGGVISGCTYGINYGSGQFLRPGVSMSLNTRDMYGLCVFDGYGATLGSATQVAAFNNNVEGLNPPNGRAQILIRDIGGVSGALKAWMYAGRIIDRSGVEPNFTVGLTRKFIFENNATPVFLDRVIHAENGKLVSVSASFQKDTNAMTQTPLMQIFDAGADPFDGYAASATFTMTDNLLQQDTTLTFTATRTGNWVVRVRGQHASGNLWMAMAITIGIGGVPKILPTLKVGLLW